MELQCLLSSSTGSILNAQTCLERPAKTRYTLALLGSRRHLHVADMIPASARHLCCSAGNQNALFKSLVSVILPNRRPCTMISTVGSPWLSCCTL